MKKIRFRSGYRTEYDKKDLDATTTTINVTLSNDRGKTARTFAGIRFLNHKIDKVRQNPLRYKDFTVSRGEVIRAIILLICVVAVIILAGYAGKYFFPNL